MITVAISSFDPRQSANFQIAEPDFVAVILRQNARLGLGAIAGLSRLEPYILPKCGTRNHKMMNKAEIGFELEIFAYTQPRVSQNSMNIMRLAAKDFFAAKGSDVRSPLRLPDAEKQFRLVGEDEVAARPK